MEVSGFKTTKDLIDALKSFPPEIDILETLNLKIELKSARNDNMRHLFMGIFIGITALLIILFAINTKL